MRVQLHMHTIKSSRQEHIAETTAVQLITATLAEEHCTVKMDCFPHRCVAPHSAKLKIRHKALYTWDAEKPMYIKSSGRCHRHRCQKVCGIKRT